MTLEINMYAGFLAMLPALNLYLKKILPRLVNIMLSQINICLLMRHMYILDICN